MTYATTFSGIGGWELGLNACGWKLKWQCEREQYCQSLLKERFGVRVYDDINTICEHNPEPVDALIGSPPCQPFSVAGEKGGITDERHLYPAFIRLVARIQPRWVLMEQVPAILSIHGGTAFAGYVGGLAALGFDCVWHCIPACAVGAPHERDRLWIVAHAAGKRCNDSIQSKDSGEEGGRPKASEWRPDRKFTALGTGYLGGNESYWHERNTSTFLRVANGVPFGMDRIHALGNAVIPQIPLLIGRSINQIEQQFNTPQD